MSNGPKIFGLIAMNDSGKSLIQSIFVKNVADKVFFSLNTAIENQISDLTNEQIIESIETDLDKTVYTHGCDLLAYPDFNKRVNKEQLRDTFSRLTYSEVVFVFVRPEEFDQFCDVGCYIHRDVRPCWLVTCHREQGVRSYASRFVQHFNERQKIKNKNIINIRFEDLIHNQKDVTSNLFDFIGLKLDKDFVNSTSPYSMYFTMIDLLNMHQYTKRTRAVNDSELHIISEITKEYNRVLGYEDVLHKNDVLPDTLDEDIDTYLIAINGVRPT